jgi:hypothetical protein
LISCWMCRASVYAVKRERHTDIDTDADIDNDNDTDTDDALTYQRNGVLFTRS